MDLHSFKSGDVVKLSFHMIDFFKDFRPRELDDVKSMTFLVISTERKKKVNVLAPDGSIVEFRTNDLEKITRSFQKARPKEKIH